MRICFVIFFFNCKFGNEYDIIVSKQNKGDLFQKFEFLKKYFFYNVSGKLSTSGLDIYKDPDGKTKQLSQAANYLKHFERNIKYNCILQN